MLNIIAYYWPRLIFAAMFALFNGFVVRMRIGKKNIILKMLAMFIISGPIVSIVTELLASNLFNSYILPGLSAMSVENTNALFVGYAILCDIVSMFLPIYLLSKISEDSLFIAASVYIQYACIDRLSLLLSFSALSYFLIMLFLVFSMSALFGKDAGLVATNFNVATWKPVLHYAFGLFFLLDALYGAYYIFPGIVNGQMDAKNAWIDAIAIVSTIFFTEFLRLNLVATKEQSQKLLYMEELRTNQNDIILKFSQISEAKSGETGQHVKRVSEYSAIIGTAYGLSENDTDILKTASMMHDFGKLLIPNEIVEKPGKLTPEENQIMQKHTEYGNDILSSSVGEVISMARTIAYEHHEKYDGTGYPRGLSGDDISIFAQIVSVADVYDALTSKRSYKEAWPPEKAYAEILNQKGRQFAPAIVDAFCSCYDKIEETRKALHD